MPSIKFFLTLLFLLTLPVFLLIWVIYWKLSGKKQNQQEKIQKVKEKKLLTYIENFSPNRLKNRRWRTIIKQQKKKPKKSARKQPQF